MLTFARYEEVILTAYKQALERGECTIELSRYSAALAMRARAYALTKKVRKAYEAGNAQAEPYVLMFGEVALRVDKARGGWIQFRRRDQDPELLAMVAQLGGAEAVLNTEELQTTQSLELVQKALALEAQASRQTDAVDKTDAVQNAVNVYLGVRS